MTKQFSFLICVFIFFSCTNRNETLFKIHASSETNIDFSNTITESPALSVLNFAYIYNGAGVAVGDVNNDGLQDVFFAGNQVSSKLYLNKEKFSFEDITDAAGIGTSLWCTGVTMVDINADGLLDIYVCTINPQIKQSSPNLFFINQGIDKNNVPHFKEMATAMMLNDSSYSTQSVFFDYDNDCDLDMYLLNNGNVEYNRNEIREIKRDGTGISNDKFYRNDGMDSATNLPHFSEVSKQAGISIEGWGLGVVATDINKDGWTDIAVANDFMSNDLLWINNHDGSFTNRINQQMKHTSMNSMGIDVADINNDALNEFATADMKPYTNEREKSMFGKQLYDKFYLGLENGYEPQFIGNSLQLNNGNGTFSDIAHMAGTNATDWSWSMLFADYDNDGYRDLYVSNGYGKDVTDLDYLSYATDATNFMFGTDSAKQKIRFDKIQAQKDVSISSFIFRNNHNLTFADKTNDWGLNQKGISNGAAYADLDNDGDLDLIVNNLNQKAFVYENKTRDAAAPKNNNHFLEIKFKGNAPNLFGIGSKVILHYGSNIQYAEMFVNHGYKSSTSMQLHFGLDTISTIDSLVVQWPSGKAQVIKNVPTNQLLVLSEKDAAAISVSFDGQKKELLFSDVLNETGIDFTHRENDYIDFKLQPLLPYQYSKCGPGMAVGDLNGDGMDDIFFGASLGDTSCIYYQQKNKKFTKKIFEASTQCEDMAALIFDANGDGNNDLFVSSGGNESPAGSFRYQSRLYINDGKGILIKDSMAIPATTASSGGAVVGADYDKDGDIDLFIAGKLSPKNYPLPAQSFLLRNDNGKFTDVTEAIAPGLQKAGMINTATWADIDNDNNIDLVIAGEWMPITIFKNNNGRFTNITATSGLAKYTGMWNSLETGDFDNDGDIDFVAGNLGLNNQYKVSDKQPMNIYAKDFNEDKRIDPIISYYLNGREVPVAYRDEMVEQLLIMRRRFQRYADYGSASFDKVISLKEREGAYTASCNFTQTSYIENKGNGKFVLTPMPMLAQTAPVYGMQVGYFNNDEFLDVLMIGNNRSTNILNGWYDAFTGLLLTGNGNGQFTAITAAQSGFFNDMDGKSFSRVMLGDKPIYVAANNNATAKIFASSATANFVKLKPDDAFAEVTLANGKKQKINIPYGSGYCSQSSRVIALPAKYTTLVITTYRGKQLKIK